MRKGLIPSVKGGRGEKNSLHKLKGGQKSLAAFFEGEKKSSEKGTRKKEEVLVIGETLDVVRLQRPWFSTQKERRKEGGGSFFEARKGKGEPFRTKDEQRGKASGVVKKRRGGGGGV